ncbi:hypothetical protein [Streptomyces daghestanicus]|uniref:Uncharacterized protein n=1 Tax=Streptomyces daghestanicus TaxID=66885 RepID=A0ABQ3Q0N3_9ACTN|nr:hypothetical protein [Streptomyces daghestanicus]GGU39532.1 hypothetical protein GCM10010259_32810 [Streptomyces daghestanicus]GHI30840.1 hypothetical protein Sdagh_25700 [Streptomyces daghestanicus]
MIVRAYVLFEVDPAADDVLHRLTLHTLGNGKVLASRLYPEHIVAGLEADGFEENEALANFNAAVAELMSENGVRRATALGIILNP